MRRARTTPTNARSRSSRRTRVGGRTRTIRTVTATRTPITSTVRVTVRRRVVTSANPVAVVTLRSAKARPKSQVNRLAGPDAVNKTGPPLDTDENVPYPEEFQHRTFAITMARRPERWEGLRARYGPWSKYLVKWRATDGHGVSQRAWAKNNRVAKGCGMKRGELGCYDSHVRVWKHIVDNNLPYALILEDDANIRYRKDHSKKMTDALQEVSKMDKDWDLLYIGTGHNNNKRKIGNGLGKCRGCQGLFAYAVTLAGAKKMLAGALPFRVPVDVYVGRKADSGQLRAYCMLPRLCYVVPVRSDTANGR